MGRLFYSTIASLDGYIADADGRYDFAEPGDDLVGFLNDQLEGIRTFLHGRRMYEEMAVWETDPELAGASGESGRFAELWRSADKVVWSTTLEAPMTDRTRIERSFDPAAALELVESVEHDLTVDGPTLARHFLLAGLVDEVHVFTVPAVVGGGIPILPTGLRLDLRLLDREVFDRGITYARYEVATRSGDR